MNIKKFFKSTTFLIIIMVICLACAGISYYYAQYKPKVDEERIKVLSKTLVSYNYNPRLAEQLVNPDGTAFRWICINRLHETNDTANRRLLGKSFTYYTEGGYKISYDIRFRTSKKFFKLDVNTQMNVLTNIYNVCNYHLQKEFVFDNDSLSMNIHGTWFVNGNSFLTGLLYCIKSHINDNNYIVETKKVDPEDISGICGNHKGLGVIYVDHINVVKDNSYNPDSVYNEYSILTEDTDLIKALRETKGITNHRIKDFSNKKRLFMTYVEYERFNRNL